MKSTPRGRNLVHHLDRAVFQNRLGARERHGIGNFPLTSFLIVVVWRSGVWTMMPFAGADDRAGAGEDAFFSVFVDGLEIIDPFVFAPH